MIVWLLYRDCGNTRLVIDIVPSFVSISTDDLSTNISIVTVSPSIFRGACIEGMEKLPLKLVLPVAAVRGRLYPQWGDYI
jgi:hypothetical protein